MENKYNLTEPQKKYFSSVLLLELIINCGREFKAASFGDEKVLEPMFFYMAEKGWITVKNGYYTPTEEGITLLKNHKEKLVEFRQFYKIYSAVDTGEGVFAYEKYFDFDSDEEFIDFLNKENFEDLRVAVCEVKNINPLEVIFLEMMDEGRFMSEGKGWENDILTGPAWNEMVEIANSNIHIKDLEETDENNNVVATGEEVMEIILKKGLELTKDLIQKQEEFDKEVENLQDEEEVITTTTTTTEEVDEYVDDPYYDSYYYDPYYDPYYVSPCWLLLWY